MSLRPKFLEFPTTFENFKDGLNHIFNTSDTSKTKQIQGMQLYQIVYDMCNARPTSYGDDLLFGIVDFLNNHCSRILQSLLHKDDIVAAYTTEWLLFCESADYVNNVCEFLNRYMSRQYDFNRTQNLASRLTVKGHAYTAWKRQILASLKKAHSNRLMLQLMDQIRQARDGQDINLDTLQTCIRSLVELNSYEENGLKLYVEEFQTLYISRTNLYYLSESNQAITSLSMNEFMTKALSRLEEEISRSAKLCHESTLPLLRSSCERHYISIHKEKIEAEFQKCIFQDQFEVAALAFQLLSKLENGIDKLVDSYQDRILSLTKSFVAGIGPDPIKVIREYIEGLINIQKQCMQICSTHFPDPAFTAAVDKAFRLTINDTSINPHASDSSLIAKYCDLLLRKSKVAISESEIEEKLSDVINIFKYLDDKDIFQKFYSRALAKRLIHGNSVSEESELNMISRLKSTCGFEYTFKLQRMFTDMTLSSELNNAFKMHLTTESLNRVEIDDPANEPEKRKKSKTNLFKYDFYIHVLTTGSWPLTPANTDFALPKELEISASAFTDFFGTRHSGRKLSWFHHLAKADVRLTFLDKPYELSISLYQLGVLMLFNDATSLTFAEIENGTRLSSAELHRALKPLVELKLLLQSNESGEKSSSNATFTLNSNFSNKRTKIKAIASGAGDSGRDELSMTKKAVEDDRRLYIQAAIVRIMKARRELGHTPLIQEVIDVAKSRFSPSVGMIKKCIEQLIEKQYIGRLENVNDMYIYLS